MERSNPWSPDAGEVARRMRSREKFSRRLGVPLPPWEPEHSAPPVDLDLLDALHGGQLDAAREREVVMRIWKYRSWAEAECRSAIERLRRSRGQDQE